MTADSFPRLSARTMNFQLGLPRGFVVSPDGARVVFLRADTGTSRTHSLWVYDVETATERNVADPAVLLPSDDEDLTPEERARRERMRVSTSGVVAFSTDDDVTVAAFALSSRLFVADLVGSSGAREVPVEAPVVDPRLDPTGRTIAYAGNRALRVVDQSGLDRVLVGPDRDDPDEVAWGLAEFIAAEELDRTRGFWWAPDGSSLLVARYDETPVEVWHIADPSHPEVEPVRQRYPQAGTANAVVSLHHVSLGGERVDLDWRSDRELDGTTLEYLVEVEWREGQPLLALLTRDQRRLELREVDLPSGVTTPVRTFTDDCWIELLPGTPRRTRDGRLLHGLDDGETRRLAVDGVPFTPTGVQVRSVLGVEDDAVVASVVPRIASVALARLGFDGSMTLLSDPGGVAVGAVGGDSVVVHQRTLVDATSVSTVISGGRPVGTLTNLNMEPPLTLNLETLRVGTRDYPTTVLFPSGHERGSRRLPVLMDPYGGPHGQRVVNATHSYLSSQWLSDQGFLVVVADGRGMAGRGPAWDRLVKDDFIGTIDDQAEILHAVAALYPDDVDTTKVAIRGWSFGGYLALAGVLRRPDVFAAAVAGAPVSDQRLYDTCYSERYLGHPESDKGVYDANDLTLLADRLSRPLMLIHGLADDNVAVAHTLRMSTALLAAGKPHEVLPLSGVTHLANSETVAENLLLLQVDFLRRAMDIAVVEDHS
ncbi:MAG: prolyl oligopeptidase family serine peptidase [Nocardioidaceae bacterium]